MKINRIGVDLAKNVFQLHGADRNGKAVWKRKLSRDKWLKVLFETVEPGTVIGMEACGGAHHWSRVLIEKGYEVKIIPPQFVKPFVKSNKNDANDAAAICEAMVRPNMHPIKVKTIEQQDLQAVHRIREEIKSHRIAKANQIRGLVTEYGLVAPRELSSLRKGRDMAAAIGLTPRQHSSGGKDRLLGISKRGDAYLRCLLVHGARSAMRTSKDTDDRVSRWITNLQDRRHANVAACAMANKIARMAWVMMSKGVDYDPDFKPVMAR